MEIEDKIIWLEKNFWDQLRDLPEDQEAADLVDWFLKVRNYLKNQKVLSNKSKQKKLTKFFRGNLENVKNAIKYFIALLPPVELLQIT